VSFCDGDVARVRHQAVSTISLPFNDFYQTLQE
jgi:hypothetical protein